MNCGQIANPCPNAVTGSAAQIFYTLINTLMAAKCSLGPEGKYPPDHSPYLKNGDEFDFIVVGAGSAGSAVASRLSSDEKSSVLVLEAGDYPSATVEIPILGFSNYGTPEDWQYTMQPGNYCKSLRRNICTCPRGKALGGSSDTNGMIYIRGNRRDFDKWAAASSGEWSYKSVVRQFKSFENVQDQVGSSFGRHGNLEITRYKFDHPIHDILTEGFEQLGYSGYEELQPLGYIDSYMTIYNGTRNNAAKAFLGKAKHRKNLKVAVNAQVSKVLVDFETKTAFAVEVRINGRLVVIKSKKEVILSAGAIASPQILMHSGVGPREVLEPLGIEVVQELPVGKNFQDHFVFPVYVSLDPSVLNPKSEIDAINDIYEYFMARKGPYSVVNLLNFLGFVNTKNDSIYPNFQTMMQIMYPNDRENLIKGLNIFNQPDEVINSVLLINDAKAILMTILILLNPHSRGRILINSTNPFDQPLIYPNYLSDPYNRDMQAVLEGARWLEHLFETKRFRAHGSKIVNVKVKSCQQYKFRSDEYWKCYMRNIGTHVFHQVGTCKMGTDSASVVDPRLRVRGVKRLRVIDASIMPFVTSANTNAPSIMIGANGARMVIEDNK